MADLYEYIKPSDLEELLSIVGVQIAPVIKDGVTYKMDPALLVGPVGPEGPTVFTFESEAAVTSAWSFVVPKEDMLDHIRVYNGIGAASDFIMTVGTTLLGTDIVDSDMGEVLLSRGQRPLIFGVGDHYSMTANTTIYVTITGDDPVANVSARLSLDT